MKLQKTITIITIILLVIIISLASFLGIYKKGDYSVVNTVPSYILGMKFENSRIINFEVDNTVESTNIYDKEGNEITEQEEGVEYTEENGYTIVENKVNSEDILTQENYKLCKQILEERLKKLGAEEYYIRLNTGNGNMQIEMPENDNTDMIISYLSMQGVFELKDSDTDEVLLNNNYIKDCNVVYGGTESNSNTVYLQISFNKEGKQKLEEISKIYVTTMVESTNEDGETEETEQTKNVDIVFDGETYLTTYFGDTITDGTLNISIGSASDAETLNDYIDLAEQMETVLNSDLLPITYNINYYTVSSTITETEIIAIACIAITILLIISIYVLIKLKTKGILAIFLEIGYVSFLLLALRYTNIKITIEGLVGIMFSVVLNYLYIYTAFKNIEDNFVKDITGKFSLKLIPIYIIAIVFTFNNIANISSLGMTLVWGIITMYLYNLVLTQVTRKIIKL